PVRRAGAISIGTSQNMAVISAHLQLVSEPPPPDYRLPCVALAHNEKHIFPEFLTHYRSLGVDRFFIVDDHSTDGSRAFLEAQPDVIIFEPIKGSSYSRDKRHWRAELLD